MHAAALGSNVACDVHGTILDELQTQGHPTGGLHAIAMIYLWLLDSQHSHKSVWQCIYSAVSLKGADAAANHVPVKSAV